MATATATAQRSQTEEEDKWEAAAAAADEGRGINLAGVDLNDMNDLFEALNVTAYAAKTRLRAFIKHLQLQHEQQQPSQPNEQPLQPRSSWHLVTGTIQRNEAIAGSRHALFKLASGGYYPEGMDPTDSFPVNVHPTERTKRLLSASVVFSYLGSAEAFIVKVAGFVASTRSIAYHTPFRTTHVEPYNNHRLILETDYVPNQADGEAPHDSPVWDVEVLAMDISALSPTTIFSRSDTVYKYQRIEAERAFARTDPEGAHIFPKAKCKGQYEWLDRPTFNRLALSRDGHKNFDGTANGQGVHAATSAIVTLEPTTTDKIMLDHVNFTRISSRLWCRNKSVANSWRPFLKAELEMGEADGHVFYEPVHICCEIAMLCFN